MLVGKSVCNSTNTVQIAEKNQVPRERPIVILRNDGKTSRVPDLKSPKKEAQTQTKVPPTPVKVPVEFCSRPEKPEIQENQTSRVPPKCP